MVTALGIVVEGIAERVPAVTGPFTNRAHAAHPKFQKRIGELLILGGGPVRELGTPSTSRISGAVTRISFPRANHELSHPPVTHIVRRKSGGVTVEFKRLTLPV